jgi:hypothetical protein
MDAHLQDVARRSVAAALLEDIGYVKDNQDVTALLVPEDAIAEATIITR